MGARVPRRSLGTSVFSGEGETGQLEEGSVQHAV